MMARLFGGWGAKKPEPEVSVQKEIKDSQQKKQETMQEITKE
jgi:hypothetical protein